LWIITAHLSTRKNIHILFLLHILSQFKATDTMQKTNAELSNRIVIIIYIKTMMYNLLFKNTSKTSHKWKVLVIIVNVCKWQSSFNFNAKIFCYTVFWKKKNTVWRHDVTSRYNITTTKKYRKRRHSIVNTSRKLHTNKG